MDQQTDMPVSLWAASAAPAPDSPPLSGEATADVAIVGGGFTGLAAALRLAQTGARAVVLEAHEIGFGGSGRNAGLVNAGLWLAPDEVEARLGAEAGQRLNAALLHSTDRVFDLISDHAIDCDAVRKGTIYLANSQKTLDGIRTRADQLNARGLAVEIVDAGKAAAMTGTGCYIGGLFDPGAGVINPMAYARGLAHAARAAGALVHERTPVTGLEPDGAGWRITTPQATVQAGKVILATNAYTDRLWPGLEQTIFPLYFFQFASPPLTENVRKTILPDGVGAWDAAKVMTAFRLDAQGRLILGSMGNMGQPPSVLLRRWADRTRARLFPQLQADEWEQNWVGRIAFTPDHLPRFHELAPGLITAIGYNGRGIGPGTIFGQAMADYIASGDETALPMDLTAPETVSHRGLRAGALEAAARLYHFGQSLF